MALVQSYQHKKVLVTGHNGFKGSWLCLWLEMLGAEVMGVSLPHTDGHGHAKSLKLTHEFKELDVRDEERLQHVFKAFQPEIVFHLAAQPLVGQSFLEPHHTFDVNLRGTLNILECARTTASVRSIVCVTSDKVYAHPSQAGALTETARLGGDSPYAASKAASEFVLASYQSSYFNSSEKPLLGIARAGNILGGGDWGEQRLFPDIIRAAFEGETLSVRHPHYQRSWLHVFDVIHGYLALGAELVQRNAEAATAFNLGPGPQGLKSVDQVLQAAKEYLPQFVVNHETHENYPEEAAILLDASKASHVFGWRPYLSFEESLKLTIDWYRQYYEKQRVVSRVMLADYIKKISQSS